MTDPLDESPADVAVRVAAAALQESLLGSVSVLDTRLIDRFGGFVDAILDRRIVLLQAMLRANLNAQQPPPARDAVDWQAVEQAVRRGLAATPDGDIDTFVANITGALRGVL